MLESLATTDTRIVTHALFHGAGVLVLVVGFVLAVLGIGVGLIPWTRVKLRKWLAALCFILSAELLLGLLLRPWEFAVAGPVGLLVWMTYGVWLWKFSSEPPSPPSVQVIQHPHAREKELTALRNDLQTEVADMEWFIQVFTGPLADPRTNENERIAIFRERYRREHRDVVLELFSRCRRWGIMHHSDERTLSEPWNPGGWKMVVRLLKDAGQQVEQLLNKD